MTSIILAIGILTIAVALEKRTAGALGADVYPDSSLMKVNAQFSSMRKGALDMSF